LRRERIFPVLQIRILIFIYPGSLIQQQQQKRRGEFFCSLIFFVATNFSKLKIIIFWTVREKFNPILVLFTQKIVTKIAKNGLGIRVPRSGSQKKTYPGFRDPGEVKKTPDLGSATPIFLSEIRRMKQHGTTVRLIEIMSSIIVLQKAPFSIPPNFAEILVILSYS
jgi:hypothetical protein